MAVRYQEKSIVSLGGVWTVSIPGHSDVAIRLPGTLDEAGIGEPEPGGVSTSRLTRRFSYEGKAVFSRTVKADVLRRLTDGGKRVFLDIERSRKLTLNIGGDDVTPYIEGTLSTPYTFEITDAANKAAASGDDLLLSLCCDNSYTGWPREPILASSAATDETQTNWCGLLGYIRLRSEGENFISAVRIYPRCDATKVDVEIELDCAADYEGTLTVSCPLFMHDEKKDVRLPAGRHVLRFDGIPVSDTAARWHEYEGALHTLFAAGSGLSGVDATFGLRDFCVANGKLMLNGRAVFLRGETNCCVFPETGYMPMTVDEWKDVLSKYISYGVNIVRFHSHCPPDAAFTAADELGVMLAPELSCWMKRRAFEDDESFGYYMLELKSILATYANHPSFVMLSLGNELCAGELGHKRMDILLDTAKSIDPTRLYACGSNFHYGRAGTDPKSDFYTACGWRSLHLRATSSNMEGHLNEKYPSAKTDYDAAMTALRTEYSGPVIGFEVGQYEVLPDFDEWKGHRGVTIAGNINAARENAEKAGFMSGWKRRVEASGELSLLCYREEVEAALRTEGMSGLFLLGLQDFPGQGTALVGMINSHMREKPFDFARPERFRSFFKDTLPLVLLEKYTYTDGETLSAEVKVANYGKGDIEGDCVVTIEKNCGDAQSENGAITEAYIKLPCTSFPQGKLTSAGFIDYKLNSGGEPVSLLIKAAVVEKGRVGGRRAIENSYRIWVYPREWRVDTGDVIIARSLKDAIVSLEAGKKVFLSPPPNEEAIPGSIKAQFSTNFWCVGTFPGQSGFMGLMMDPNHPVFAHFPTEFHTDYQWWPMTKGRAILIPPHIEPIVCALDSIAHMRHMGMLFEANACGGVLVASGMGLFENFCYPEARALYSSIMSYMNSPAFSPKDSLTKEELAAMFR